jgi:hypothetical protein
MARNSLFSDKTIQTYEYLYYISDYSYGENIRGHIFRTSVPVTIGSEIEIKLPPKEQGKGHRLASYLVKGIIFREKDRGVFAHKEYELRVVEPYYNETEYAQAANKRRVPCLAAELNCVRTSLVTLSF